MFYMASVRQNDSGQKGSKHSRNFIFNTIIITDYNYHRYYVLQSQLQSPQSALTSLTYHHSGFYRYINMHIRITTGDIHITTVKIITITTDIIIIIIIIDIHY